MAPQSAGATSVCVHLALAQQHATTARRQQQPPPTPLFAAALLESPYACDSAWALDDALEVTATFAPHVAGCDDADNVADAEARVRDVQLHSDGA